jgi:hypothetical protein
MRIEGTLFNELRDDGSATADGPVEPRRRGSVTQNRGTYLRPWAPPTERERDEGYGQPVVVENGTFRRVVVPRRRAELASFGERVAAQLRSMTGSDVHCHPTPSARRCVACSFRAPCLTMNLGDDPAGLLAAGYVQRSHDPEPGQLGGGTWSVGRGAAPPDFGRSAGPR